MSSFPDDIDAEQTLIINGIPMTKKTIASNDVPSSELPPTSEVESIHETNICEAGIFKALVESDCPKAHAFLNWTVSNVLPVYIKWGMHMASEDELVLEGIAILMDRNG